MKELWLTVGLPASGKSTWARKKLDESIRANQSITRISPDDIRFDTDCSIAQAWMTARSNLMDAIAEKSSIIILDATSLNWNSRREWHKLANLTGYKVRAFLFDVDFDICMERNAAREGQRKVPEEVMVQFREVLSWPVIEEGFISIEKIGPDDESR
jgi:predicted kinase